MMRNGTVVGMVAALGLLTGCGAQASAPSSSSNGSMTSTTATASSPTRALLTKEQLDGALLSVRDVPPGFAVDKGETNKNKTFCGYKPPVEERLRASRTFIKGGGLGSEVLSVGLRQYSSAKDARAAFDAMTKALETCTTETVNGQKAEYSVMSAPKVGDDSVGVRMTLSQGTVLQNFALVGPVLVSAGTGGAMNASAEVGSQTFEQQVKKYQGASEARGTETHAAADDVEEASATRQTRR